MRFFPIKPHQVLLTACRDARFVRPLHQNMKPTPAPPKGGGPNYMQTHLMFVCSPLLRRGWKRSQYNWFFPIIPRQILLPACRDTRFVRPLHQIMRPRPALPKGGAPNCMRTLLMFVRSPLLRRGWKRSQYNWFFPIIPRQMLLPACRDARFVRPLHQNMKPPPAPPKGGGPNYTQTHLLFVRSPLLRRGRGRS